MDTTAVIKSLLIERFRGIEKLEWNPSPNVNVLIGGGDVGKSTVLDAISLLLSPTNSVVLSESDFWNKNSDDGFIVQAFFSFSASTGINNQPAFSWPWEWDGTQAKPPILDSEDEPSLKLGEPVYCIRVKGTSDLELLWEVVQPNQETNPLSTALRRTIGVVRLSGEDRYDRDLRLVYGSALDRLLTDPGLRARIGQEVAAIDLRARLSNEKEKALNSLDKTLKENDLPHTLDLGLTSAQGLSIGALVGLHAAKTENVSLPLSSWGSGTRRMTTLQIAASTQTGAHINIVDELERGLEPYRARKLVKVLEGDESQSFVTTHSPVVLGAATHSQLWFMDSQSVIGELSHKKISKHQESSPSTFLSKFSIICEGKTEIGLLSILLDKFLDGSYLDLGVFLADGDGNRTTLDLLQAISGTGILFGGIADDEGDADGRWAELKKSMGDTLLRWDDGNTESNIIGAIPHKHILSVIEDDSGEKSGIRRRHLADRLGIANKGIDSIIQAADSQGIDLRELIIAAASGNTEDAPDDQTRKEWKKHGQQWFKSIEGGREIADKMFMLEAWPALSSKFGPFLNEIRIALDQECIEVS